MPSSDNFYKAYLAFYEAGIDCELFHTPEKLLESQLEDVVVGYVGAIRWGLKQFGIDKDVWCSEPINIVAEWRCFVRYGRILDIRPYKGDYYNYHYDFRVIENCISDYKTAPAGYAVDFGVTDDDRTILIEVNDGYALGSYGLLYYDYAKLHSARWAELTGTKDFYDFVK